MAQQDLAADAIQQKIVQELVLAVRGSIGGLPMVILLPHDSAWSRRIKALLRLCGRKSKNQLFLKPPGPEPPPAKVSGDEPTNLQALHMDPQKP